jgi:hypothetical protein
VGVGVGIGIGVGVGVCVGANCSVCFQGEECLAAHHQCSNREAITFAHWRVSPPPQMEEERLASTAMHGQSPLARWRVLRQERECERIAMRPQRSNGGVIYPCMLEVYNSLGYILWAQYFMQEQGYNMDALLLYQDNISLILLKTNGQASGSKCTKHIKVKYYFIKDKVGQGEITIEHCPTNQMWTYINTKPKQGLVFCMFRGHVMGIPKDYRDSDYKR